MTPDRLASHQRLALDFVHGGRQRGTVEQGVKRTLSGFLERLLGHASFRLYQLVRRWQRQRLFEAFSVAKRAPLPRWYALTEWLVRASVHPALMALINPRLNCHAVIALTDFFQLRRTLAVRCAEAEGSAVYWTLVVYDARFQIVEQLGNTCGRRRGPASKLQEINLPPGRYMLGLRYYEAPQRVVFPEVWTDGQPLISAQLCCEEARRYEHYLSRQRDGSSLSQLLLQYHAYAFLKHREHYDESWLCSRYLPAGNPEMGVLFGVLEKGQLLRIAPSRRAGGETYVTIYDRASRALRWEQVREPLELPILAAGTYLIRYVSRAGSFIPADLEVEVTSG